jgi:hypothetical protein
MKNQAGPRLVDGSVQTIASDIDKDAWTDFGTRAGLPK